MPVKALIARLHSLTIDKDFWSIIHQYQLLNLWLPSSYNGLDATFKDGLQLLQTCARLNGSFGWTVTLLSGAHYFLGFIEPSQAQQLFKHSPLVIGGSGQLNGQWNQDYLSGDWSYATGAHHLTHFTFNTIHPDTGLMTSGLVEKQYVSLHTQWNSMGLYETDTQHYSIHQAPKSSLIFFQYNQPYLEGAVFKIPFVTFADATLFVNYLGMCQHYISFITKSDDQQILANAFVEIEETFYKLIDEIMKNNGLSFETFHKATKCLVEELVQLMVKAHIYGGLRLVQRHNPAQQVFFDFFTATQHHHFRY